MGDLDRTRKKFIAAAAVLGLIALPLLVYLVWGGSQSAQQAQEADLEQQIRTLTKEIALRKSSDPAKTREDLRQLYASGVPSRQSQISQRLEKLFQESGVTPQSIRYTPDTSSKITLPDVQQLKVETTVTGDYTKIARFINAVEQDKLLFLIDRISLNSQQARSQQEQGGVSLQITFNAFLKEAAETSGKART